MSRTLISACCSIGQKKNGVQFGGFEIIKHFLEKGKLNLFSDINVCNIKTREDYLRLYVKHNNALRTSKPVTIGGDHSISIATVSSSLRTYKDDLHVIWVDAHPDLHTSSTSISQNTHGMVVGQLLGLDVEHKFVNAKLKPEQLTYIGLRDVDKAECSVIENKNIMKYSSQDVIMQGVQKVINEIKQNTLGKKYHISIDVDSLKPEIFPCTGTKVNGGLLETDIQLLLRECYFETVAVDVVEYNPKLGNVAEVEMCNSIVERIVDSVYFYDY